MATLKAGDKISCRVNDNVIVSPFREANDVKVFEIVAVGEYGYYVFVPHYIYIKDSKLIDARWCKRLEINLRFLDEQMAHITESMVYQIIQILDGMFCNICQQFFAMAAPNQEDKTMVCWSCRLNPYH